MRIVQRDETLPHQIVIGLVGINPTVSCNCQGQREGSTGGPLRYVPFGIATDTRTAKKMYNNPENHDQFRKPFTAEHMLEEQ